MLNINEIKFGNEKSAEIFSDIAQRAAKHIKTNKNLNKTTQLRKFYDELAMWNDRVQLVRENKAGKFQELIPFIKMLKAKVAYAEGRKNVDKNFSDIFNRCIDQISNVETLRYKQVCISAQAIVKCILEVLIIQ